MTVVKYRHTGPLLSPHLPVRARRPVRFAHRSPYLPSRVIWIITGLCLFFHSLDTSWEQGPPMFTVWSQTDVVVLVARVLLGHMRGAQCLLVE